MTQSTVPVPAPLLASLTALIDLYRREHGQRAADRQHGLHSTPECHCEPCVTAAVLLRAAAQVAGGERTR